MSHIGYTVDTFWNYSPLNSICITFVDRFIIKQHHKLLLVDVIWEIAEAYTKKVILEVLQKKAIRAITGAKYNDASSPLFRHLKDLRDMYIQHCVYEFVNDSLPKSLSHIFEYNRDIHRHNTRHINDPRPLKANADIMRRRLLCRGPILWMDLNIDIRNCRFSTESFWRLVFSHEWSSWR